MESTTYATTDKTILGRVAEVAKGTVTGQPAAVNKLREITQTDVQEWRGKH
jgi:hypothetical protein